MKLFTSTTTLESHETKHDFYRNVQTNKYHLTLLDHIEVQGRIGSWLGVGLIMCDDPNAWPP